MITLPGAAIEYLTHESRRLTVCGLVEKADGSTVRCTQHDADIVIADGDLAGTYFSSAAITASAIKSSSDLSTDNLEVSGALADGFDITGVSVDDIVAGLYRSAPFQIFICRWDDPNAWQKVMRRGYLGQITRSAEGAFTAEWRGMLQQLQQNIGRVYSETCDVVRFGDSRCKIDVTPLQVTTSITAVASRRQFTVDLSALGVGPPIPGPTYFQGGNVEFLDGANAGYTKQIKRDNVGSTFGAFELWENLPKDVATSTAVKLTPDCTRTFERCGYWGNTVNFRGHGRWIPGIPKILRAPSGGADAKTVFITVFDVLTGHGDGSP